jgi:phosphatidylcholine synthase
MNGTRLASIAHLITALGAACALLAALALIDRDWQRFFAWLGAALIVDAVDGPIARRLDVNGRLPRFSGDRLDLVIDYITYVFLPALALLHSGRLAGGIGLGLAILIVMSSLFHFSDTQSKTDDHCFVGFPAIWNVVAFYVFVWELGEIATAAIVLLCIALTFYPLKWVHPIRVQALRPLTAVAAALWGVSSAWIVAQGFPAGSGPAWVLLACTAYAVALSVWHGRSAV